MKASAQDRVLERKTGWAVGERDVGTQGKKLCSMRAQFADDTLIYLDVDPSASTFQLRFENQDWRTLPDVWAPQADHEFQTRLTFNGVEEAPVRGVFWGVRGSEGPRLFIALALSDMPKILGPIARAESLRLETNGNLVGVYAMNGTTDAAQRLHSCINALRERTSSDPFRRP